MPTRRVLVLVREFRTHSDVPEVKNALEDRLHEQRGLLELARGDEIAEIEAETAIQEAEAELVPINAKIASERQEPGWDLACSPMR